MEPYEMLDYVLGQLESPQREQVEHEAACDPALADKLCRLARCVHRLLDDNDPAVPTLNPPIFHSRLLECSDERAIVSRT